MKKRYATEFYIDDKYFQKRERRGTTCLTGRVLIIGVHGRWIS